MAKKSTKKNAVSDQDQTPHDVSDRISEQMTRTLIAADLELAISETEKRKRIDVIVDLNLLYPEGLAEARRHAHDLIVDVANGRASAVDVLKSEYSPQHLFANLTATQLRRLLVTLQDNLTGENARPIYKIWLDSKVHRLLTESVKTVKSDAALVAFGASGERICWAVLDSGVDGNHSHFKTHKNLDLDPPLRHMDFTTSPVKELDKEDLTDPYGHGTHVAGIIAGELGAGDKPAKMLAKVRQSEDEVTVQSWKEDSVRGVAPQCQLLSLRVLDENGNGKASNIIAALNYVRHLNSNDRWPKIHGVNLSVGYEFEAEWFACGHSPLCVEVNRLVRTGVVVVAAAGNTGYGFSQTQSSGARRSGLDLSINDPGNAELAITVGATHQREPHTYGVSYFSSKGPTGDGRLKPDLVAPGERIMSCGAGKLLDKPLDKFLRKQSDGEQPPPDRSKLYVEESGTSMAAPHVSGAIASFLSIRREFIGEPERGQADLHLDSNRPETRSPIPGIRLDRPDASYSIGLT